MAENPVALRLELRSSPRLQLLVGLSVWGAIASVWLTPIPAGLQGALFIVILIWTPALLKRPGVARTASLLWDREGRWFQRSAGEAVPLELEGDYLLLPWLVILNFSSQGGKRLSVLCTADNLEGEAFRRLRARLRLVAASKPKNRG